jgi:hypothetical protein
MFNKGAFVGKKKKKEIWRYQNARYSDQKNKNKTIYWPD